MIKTKYAIVVHLPRIDEIPLFSRKYLSKENVYRGAKTIKNMNPGFKVVVERINDKEHIYDEITAAD